MGTGSIEHEAYVLGTHDEELERLGWQHRVWADAAIAHWQRAGFVPGQTILDVGCGPGFGSKDLAELLGTAGRVIGIDASARYVGFVNEVIADDPNTAPIEAHQGDVQQLDLPEASVDGAYARWVLSFTPEPMRVVEGIARALRPGGRFAVQDYAGWSGLFWGPRSETLGLLRRAVTGAYESVGADSDIGRKLPGMMHASGFDVLEIRPLQRTARPGDALWHWPTRFFKLFLPRVVEMGFMTQGEFEAWCDEWDSLTRDEGAFFFTPPQVEIIGVKR